MSFIKQQLRELRQASIYGLVVVLSVAMTLSAIRAFPTQLIPGYSLRDALMQLPTSNFSLLSQTPPVTATFSFQSPEEFETKAKEAVLPWVENLAGKSFHVRMHRRGFKGRISSPESERFLDKILLEELVKIGHPGQITFEDPEAIIVVETVGQQAGLSCWSREDLQRYPLLKLD